MFLGLKDRMTYETVSGIWNLCQMEMKTKMDSPQVSLLFLSFFTKVACVVGMGTNLRKTNQWVKNKSENNDNKLDSPPPPPQLLAQLFLVWQARQSTVTAKLINDLLERFFLRVQFAEMTGSRVDHAMISARNEEDFTRKSYKGKQWSKSSCFAQRWTCMILGTF